MRFVEQGHGDVEGAGDVPARDGRGADSPQAGGGEAGVLADAAQPLAGWIPGGARCVCRHEFAQGGRALTPVVVEGAADTAERAEDVTGRGMAGPFVLLF